MRHLPALLFLVACGSTTAADGDERHGLWGNFDIGFGSLHMTPDMAHDSTHTRLYFALAGGYTLHPQLQLGLETGGWNIKSGNLRDADRGEGLMQLFAVARYWPTATSKLFVKAAGGNITHWNNAADTTKGTGTGYSVGLGYELTRFAGIESHWFLNYSAGSVSGYTPTGGLKQGEDYRALTAGLSFGF